MGVTNWSAFVREDDTVSIFREKAERSDWPDWSVWEKEESAGWWIFREGTNQDQNVLIIVHSR